MTIDERLEALTHTVELLAQMHRDTEQANAHKVGALDERLGALTQSLELLAQMHRDNENANAEKFGALMDTMNRLGRIIEMHEHRLDSHDDRLDDLEGQ